MPRVVDEQDWDDDEGDWEPDDEPDDDEQAAPFADVDEPTIPCPYCHESIHEDSVRCPHCEQYISTEDEPTTRKPWWIILGFILCGLIAYMWIAP